MNFPVRRMERVCSIRSAPPTRAMYFAMMSSAVWARRTGAVRASAAIASSACRMGGGVRVGFLQRNEQSASAARGTGQVTTTISLALGCKRARRLAAKVHRALHRVGRGSAGVRDRDRRPLHLDLHAERDRGALDDALYLGLAEHLRGIVTGE